MGSAMRLWLSRAKLLLRTFENWPFNPPFNSNLCLAYLDGSPGPTGKPRSDEGVVPNSLSDLLGVDLSLLWAVPKHKTSRPKKRMKQYNFFRLLHPHKNLIACQQCGNYHEIHCICGHCYAKVREETDLIKEQMNSLDPYKELPDKETLVLYEGETPDNSHEFWNGKRIVEVKKSRPPWFSADLKKRWHKLGLKEFE